MLSVTHQSNTPQFSSKTEYIEQLKLLQPGFFSFKNHDDELSRMAEWVSTNRKRIDEFATIIVLGIGGSMLGPQSLYTALRNSSTPNIQFVDNIDPDIVFDVLKSIDTKKTLVIVQSKSGMTPETNALYFTFKKLFIDNSENLSEHFVFITDPKQGYLREAAIQHSIPVFDVPPEIGGRFSVLTPIGLLIAELCGWSYKDFIQGARDMLDRELSNESVSLMLAQSIAILSLEGVNISVLMPYSSRLRLISDWYTQLLSESIGKINIHGKAVGITPLSSLGTTDQHSKLQLYQDGPLDKLILFLEVNQFDNIVPINSVHLTEFSYMNGNTLNDLIRAELNATRQSLSEANKPSYTLTIDAINPKELGSLYMFFQCVIAYLGLILEVDAYNQPGVERSKELTKEFLAKHSS